MKSNINVIYIYLTKVILNIYHKDYKYPMYSKSVCKKINDYKKKNKSTNI